MWHPKRVLAVAPHTDDYEVGAGGYIHRLIRAGVEVNAVAFSTAKESLIPGLPADTLNRECVAASGKLGIKRENLEILDFPVRRFDACRQEILEYLVLRMRETMPDLILVHCTTDTHQDHQVVTAEAIRAFRERTILGYEIPRNCLSFKATSIVQIEPVDLEAKLSALREYGSQQHRSTVKPDGLTALAKVRGISIGCELAEAFEVIRWVQPLV